MIQARIRRMNEHFLLEFRDSLVEPANWAFQITFEHIQIHGEWYFLPLDGDINYEEDEIEPPSTVEQMIQDIIPMRWPVPFPHHLMLTAAKTAWEHKPSESSIL